MVRNRNRKRNKNRLIDQCRIINGEYQCPYCKEMFSSLGISPHIKSKHLGHNPFKNAKHWSKGKTANDDIRIKRIAESSSITQKGKRGKLHTDKTKEILSMKRSQVIEELGVGGFKNVKWFNVENIKGDNFIVRGQWELKIAQWLNEHNIIWIRKIYLKYKKGKINKTYCPDFYLPEHSKYIEVKGYYSELDKLKIDLVQKQNRIKVDLIFGKTINNLSNIKSLNELLN